MASEGDPKHALDITPGEHLCKMAKPLTQDLPTEDAEMKDSDEDLPDDGETTTASSHHGNSLGALDHRVGVLFGEEALIDSEETTATSSQHMTTLDALKCRVNGLADSMRELRQKLRCNRQQYVRDLEESRRRDREELNRLKTDTIKDRAGRESMKTSTREVKSSMEKLTRKVEGMENFAVASGTLKYQVGTTPKEDYDAIMSAYRGAPSSRSGENNSTRAKEASVGVETVKRCGEKASGNAAVE